MGRNPKQYLLVQYFEHDAGTSSEEANRVYPLNVPPQTDGYLYLKRYIISEAEKHRETLSPR